MSSVIAGATKPEQLEQNVKAVEWALTPEDLAEIDRLGLWELMSISNFRVLPAGARASKHAPAVGTPRRPASFEARLRLARSG